MSKKFLNNLIEFFKETYVAFIILGLILAILHIVKCEKRACLNIKASSIVFLNSIPVPRILLILVLFIIVLFMIIIAICIIFPSIFKRFKK